MKRILFLLIVAISAITMQAKDNSETITGVGATQLEAIKNSIENVLSQKYSVWTAAMTKMVNDDITDSKTISTTDPNANIKSYKILSLENIDGEWKVTAAIKTSRSSVYLQQIKRNYGLMQKTNPLDIPAMPLLPPELEDEDQKFKVGQSLDKKLLRAIVDQFRAEREQDLHQLLVSLVEQYQDGMYDYDVNVEKSDNNTVKVKVTVNKNKNTYNIAGLITAFIYSSARGIDNNPSEIRPRTGKGYGPAGSSGLYDLLFDAGYTHFYQAYGIGFELYNRDAERLERAISTLLTSGIFGFKIVDNLGKERYMAVLPDGKLKKVGKFDISPDYKKSVPLFCGLGNTKILLHSFKYINDPKSVVKLEFTIPYTSEEYRKLEEVTIEPFNQNISELWRKPTLR